MQSGLMGKKKLVNRRHMKGKQKKKKNRRRYNKIYKRGSAAHQCDRNRTALFAWSKMIKGPRTYHAVSVFHLFNIFFFRRAFNSDNRNKKKGGRREKNDLTKGRHATTFSCEPLESKKLFFSFYQKSSWEKIRYIDKNFNTVTSKRAHTHK